MFVARLASLGGSVSVVIAYGLWAPPWTHPVGAALAAAVSGASRLGAELRAGLLLGAVALALAWAIGRALGLAHGLAGGVASGVAACLLVHSAPWLAGGAASVAALAAALVAVASGRRLAEERGGGAAAAPGQRSPATQDATAAAVAVLIAASLDPGYAALAAPLLALWWLRVGPPASPRGRRADVAWIALGRGLIPLLLLLAGVVAWRGWGRGASLLWPHPATGRLAVSGVPDATRAAAALLGPTATVAALGGLGALLSPRRAEGAWLGALLGATALGGLGFDVHRGVLGGPLVVAAALAVAVAIHRLAALAALAPGVSSGAPRGPLDVGGSGAPRVSVDGGSGAHVRASLVRAQGYAAYGAILLALTAGFLILAPPLLIGG
ncbi:MAG: hypothetical protein R3B48_19250 [Kofleriaceae bacterium]